MHPRVLAMYHSSFQPKESLQCMIIPCNQSSPCYVPSCLPKQKSPHKVSQGITLKESLLFLNHLFTTCELWKMGRTLFLELKCCRNSIPPKQSLQNFQNLFLLNKLLRKNKDSFCVKYVDILQGLLCCRWHDNTLKGHLRKL